MLLEIILCNSHIGEKMEHLNINSLQNNEKMNQVNVSKNKVVKGESTNIPKISEDESKKIV